MSEIGNTLYEKKLNLFHIIVGVIFASLPSLIANNKLTNTQLVNGLYMLGIAIIIFHIGIILIYHYDKTQAVAVKEEYGGTPNRGNLGAGRKSEIIKCDRGAVFNLFGNNCCSGYHMSWGWCVKN